MFWIALVVGILSMLAVFILMSRLGIKRCMGYPIIVDVLGSALFTILFWGTLTGMMIAAVAAIALSLSVWLVRKTMGYERFSIKTRGWQVYPAA